jgi:hypothetical protein
MKNSAKTRNPFILIPGPSEVLDPVLVFINYLDASSHDSIWFTFKNDGALAVKRVKALLALYKEYIINGLRDRYKAGEINLEKENLRIVVSDIERAQKELASPNPSPTILAGAASYIAQCYGGIESILKRIIRNRNAELGGLPLIMWMAKILPGIRRAI